MARQMRRSHEPSLNAEAHFVARSVAHAGGIRVEAMLGRSRRRRGALAMWSCIQMPPS
jgi:hypothetical protein